jgi:hypothetical protein
LKLNKIVDSEQRSQRSRSLWLRHGKLSRVNMEKEMPGPNRESAFFLMAAILSHQFDSSSQ